MVTHRKLLASIAVVTTIIIGPGLLYLSPAVDTRAACEITRDWIDEAQLPATTAQLIAYPLRFQKPLFSNLSSQAKASAWKQHLSDALVSNDQFSAEQRSFIHAVQQHIGPTLYDHPVINEEARAPIKALLAGANNLFTSDEIRSLFYTLGGYTKPSRSAGSIRYTIADTLRNWAVVDAQQYSCDCYAQDPMCYGAVCSELQGCFFWYFGCGLMYWDPCNGLCMW